MFDHDTGSSELLIEDRAVDFGATAGECESHGRLHATGWEDSRRGLRPQQ